MTRVRCATLVLAGLAVAVMCAAAEAQPPGGGQGRGPGMRGPGMRGPGMGGPGGFGGVGLTQLLFSEKVRTDCKITDEQVEKLREAREERPRGRREDFQRFRDMEPEQRAAEMAKMREQRAKEEQELLGKVLSEDQVARLKQIRLQMMGFNALGQAEVRTALEITREQGQKLMELRTALREETQKLREGMPDMRNMRDMRDASQEERMQAMQKFREAMQEMGAKRSAIQENYLNKALETVLTGETSSGDTQKEAWAKLVGEKIELSMQDLMPQRGPRGGGPDGQPGQRRRPGGRQGGRQGGQ